MRSPLVWAALGLLFTAAHVIAAEDDVLAERHERAVGLKPLVLRLQPLHEPLGEPRSGEWLYAHLERGQTFWQYVENAENLPTPVRRTIYIQPLGTFTKEQRRITELAAEFLCLYYRLRVHVQPRESLSVIPAHLRRVKTASGVPQLDIANILGGYLRRDFPRDAAVRVAVTTADLERPRGRNLTSVFGMAYLYHRTAVASLYRMGDPHENRDEFRRCLLRSLKLIAHETGHALSMRHCRETACNMNGRNSLLEMDHKPLWLCPDCVAKVCWAGHIDPRRRFERLRDFCAQHGLVKEERFFDKSARALTGWKAWAHLKPRGPRDRQPVQTAKRSPPEPRVPDNVQALLPPRLAKAK